ncbi:MAG: hypothetical protein RL693_566, partial [Verrucomicrobiota bacterium]
SSLRYDCYLSEGITSAPDQTPFLKAGNLRGLRVNTYGQISEVVTSPLPK